MTTSILPTRIYTDRIIAHSTTFDVEMSISNNFSSSTKKTYSVRVFTSSQIGDVYFSLPLADTAFLSGEDATLSFRLGHNHGADIDVTAHFGSIASTGGSEPDYYVNINQSSDTQTVTTGDAQKLSFQFTNITQLDQSENLLIQFNLASPNSAIIEIDDVILSTKPDAEFVSYGREHENARLYQLKSSAYRDVGDDPEELSTNAHNDSKFSRLDHTHEDYAAGIQSNADELAAYQAANDAAVTALGDALTATGEALDASITENTNEIAQNAQDIAEIQDELGGVGAINVVTSTETRVNFFKTGHNLIIETKDIGKMRYMSLIFQRDDFGAVEFYADETMDVSFAENFNEILFVTHPVDIGGSSRNLYGFLGDGVSNTGFTLTMQVADADARVCNGFRLYVMGVMP